MSVKEFLGSLFKNTIIDEVKETVKHTMEDVEVRTKRIVHNVIKAIIILVMVLIGSIFALVGLGKYLSETVNSLNHGVGFIVVGAVIILFAIFAKLMQKE
ncbi:MAG: hypothetical protein AB7V77_01620 [Candidatus Woesearchaeota archaeon]